MEEERNAAPVFTLAQMLLGQAMDIRAYVRALLCLCGKKKRGRKDEKDAE